MLPSVACVPFSGCDKGQTQGRETRICVPEPWSRESWPAEDRCAGSLCVVERGWRCFIYVIRFPSVSIYVICQLFGPACGSRSAWLTLTEESGCEDRGCYWNHLEHGDRVTGAFGALRASSETYLPCSAWNLAVTPGERASSMQHAANQGFVRNLIEGTWSCAPVCSGTCWVWKLRVSVFGTRTRATGCRGGELGALCTCERRVSTRHALILFAARNTLKLEVAGGPDRQHLHDAPHDSQLVAGDNHRYIASRL